MILANPNAISSPERKNKKNWLKVLKDNNISKSSSKIERSKFIRS
jgi:hypothetical protein